MPLPVFEEHAEALARLEGSTVRVRPSQCLNLRHQRAGCRACADACPTGALRWSPKLRAEPYDCSQCGVCGVACPSGALEVQATAWQERLARISQAVREGGALLLACPVHLRGDRSLRRRADLVEVPCLGAVAPWELVAAITFGAREVWLLVSRCQRCSYRAAYPLAAQTVARVNGALEAWGRAERVTLQTEPPPTPASASRRGLAWLWASRGPNVQEELARRGVTLEEAPEPASPESQGLPQRVPDGHRRWISFLEGLGRPAGRGRHALFPDVIVSERCTGCGMCAYFCPTGALQACREAEEVALLFNAQACTTCGLCARLCYQDALRLEAGTPEQVLDGQPRAIWRGRPRTPQDLLRTSAGL